MSVTHLPRRDLQLVAGRVPPHDLVAEAAVLAAIMEDHERADELASMLRPDEFYSEANARIYDAAQRLKAEGKPCDTVTVASYLHSRETLASIGGPAYIAQLVGSAPAYTAAWAYAETVREKASLRRMVAEAQTIAAEGYGDVGEAKAWLLSCAARIEHVAEHNQAAADKPSTIGEAIRTAYARIVSGEANGVQVTTGNPDVDRLLGRLGPGDLMVIGARTHVGKSTYMRGMACHVAAHHGHALLWSGEQDRERCATAMVSCEAGVSMSAREFTPSEWERLTAAASKLSRLPIEIVDRPKITGPGLRAAVRMAKRNAENAGSKLRAVFVDYVQIMSGRDLPDLEKGANRERQISELSKYLKAEIAMGEGVLVVLGAQLNKDMDKRGADARPRTADLRESAALEQDADKILLIHNPNALARAAAFRDSGNREPPPQREVAELIVAKARDGGQLGTARSIFWPQSGRFDPYAEHLDTSGRTT